MAAGDIIGKVASIQGQAFIQAQDGSRRPLKVGDLVHEGEVILTADNSRVANLMATSESIPGRLPHIH